MILGGSAASAGASGMVLGGSGAGAGGPGMNAGGWAMVPGGSGMGAGDSGGGAGGSATGGGGDGVSREGRAVAVRGLGRDSGNSVRGRWGEELSNRASRAETQSAFLCVHRVSVVKSSHHKDHRDAMNTEIQWEADWGTRPRATRPYRDYQAEEPYLSYCDPMPCANLGKGKAGLMQQLSFADNWPGAAQFIATVWGQRPLGGRTKKAQPVSRNDAVGAPPPRWLTPFKWGGGEHLRQLK